MLRTRHCLSMGWPGWNWVPSGTVTSATKRALLVQAPPGVGLGVPVASERAGVSLAVGALRVGVVPGPGCPLASVGAGPGVPVSAGVSAPAGVSKLAIWLGAPTCVSATPGVSLGVGLTEGDEQAASHSAAASSAACDGRERMGTGRIITRLK